MRILYGCTLPDVINCMRLLRIVKGRGKTTRGRTTGDECIEANHRSIHFSAKAEMLAWTLQIRKREILANWILFQS